MSETVVGQGATEFYIQESSPRLLSLCKFQGMNYNTLIVLFLICELYYSFSFTERLHVFRG